MQQADSVDQASGLRRLLGGQEDFFAIGIFGPDAGLNALATANLAHALARRGDTVCVIDELPGPRNVAGYLGISIDIGLAEIVQGGATLAGAMAESPAGVRLLAAGEAVAWVASLPDSSWHLLGEELQRLAPRWLLFTAGEGDMPSLALACTRRLLILPALRDRLPEAYAVLKSATQRQPDGQWRVLVMNSVNASQAEQLMASLQETTRRFLDIPLEHAVTVPKDEKLQRSVRAMRPILEVAPDSAAGQSFRTLAETMPGWLGGGVSMALDVLWQRLGLFSRMSVGAVKRKSTRIQHGRVYG